MQITQKLDIIDLQVKERITIIGYISVVFAGSDFKTKYTYEISKDFKQFRPGVILKVPTPRGHATVIVVKSSTDIEDFDVPSYVKKLTVLTDKNCTVCP